MRLRPVLAIAAWVLLLSAALPLAASGEESGLTRVTPTPTRTRPPSARVPSATPTKVASATPTLPLFIPASSTSTATLQGGGQLVATATTVQGGGQQVKTATVIQGGGQQAPTTTVIQGGGQLAPTSTTTGGPPSSGEDAFPVPPWILVVLGVGLLGGAFLGFKYLGGPDTKGANRSDGEQGPPEPIQPGMAGPPDPIKPGMAGPPEPITPGLNSPPDPIKPGMAGPPDPVKLGMQGPPDPIKPDLQEPPDPGEVVG